MGLWGRVPRIRRAGRFARLIRARGPRLVLRDGFGGSQAYS